MIIEKLIFGNLVQCKSRFSWAK